MPEVHRYVPVSADYLTALESNGNLHAVWTGRELDRPDGLPRTVCGISGTALAMFDNAPMPWPPYRSRRCLLCWLQTGKPRPSHAWRNLKGPTDG